MRLISGWRKKMMSKRPVTFAEVYKIDGWEKIRDDSHKRWDSMVKAYTKEVARRTAKWLNKEFDKYRKENKDE